MTEIIAQKNTEPSILGSLAQEAQYYSRSLATSMIQLGRVLTEAKPLVRHGEWENWIADNVGCTPRCAQLYMQAHARFGDNEAVLQIGERGKIFKLLALPAGTEERFLADNDVSDMTTREVEAAVRRVREEMQAEIDAERKARQLAEAAPTGIPDEVREQIAAQEQKIREQQEELSRVGQMGREAIQEANRLRLENADLRQEVVEQEAILNESQEEYNKLQADLLNMQSMAAKGDAERVPLETLDLDAFTSAVRQFMGACARMPQMYKRFAIMPMVEKNDWDELLLVIENWAVDARKALNTMEAEGVVVYE